MNKKYRRGMGHSRAGQNESPMGAEIAPVIVKLSRYCELTGDTPDAVHMRRRRGEWVDGRHCHIIGGRRLWIDLAEVNAWIRSSGIQPH